MPPTLRVGPGIANRAPFPSPIAPKCTDALQDGQDAWERRTRASKMGLRTTPPGSAGRRSSAPNESLPAPRGPRYPGAMPISMPDSTEKSCARCSTTAAESAGTVGCAADDQNAGVLRCLVQLCDAGDEFASIAQINIMHARVCYARWCLPQVSS